MKISIFTPTNNTQWLDIPYKSIISQLPNNNFTVEWVIIPNGTDIQIPANIRSHDWVKIFSYTEETITIGGLKKFACEKASGDIFLELDHDDELLPNSLEKIYTALKEKNNAFLFSDAIYVRSDKKSPLYNSIYGWEYYNYEGYPINKTFLPTARSLCEIFWAPDHVRVWTREAYNITGGHDSALFVGDDHDLVIRTYLKGVEFVQIKEPLYKYFVHGNNSWLQNCQKVQIQQANNRDKYLRDLVFEWCRRESLPVVRYNTSSFDSAAKNSAGCIVIKDELTTIPYGDSIILFMNDCYSKLVPGGWLLIDVPSTDGRGAWCDPYRASFWNELSFRYYCDKNVAKFAPKSICRFQQVVLKTEPPTKWHADNNIPYVRSDMCALKDQRQPGRCYI